MPKGFFKRRPKPAHTPRIEGLETRLALSTTLAPLPAVAVASARTVDSQNVTIQYNVNSPNLPSGLTFGVFRSADASLDASDTSVTSVDLAANGIGKAVLDDAGQNAASVGQHTLTIPVPGGLTIEPDRPYVLIVANPKSAGSASDLAARTGVIHTHSIAVVTHGGLQSKADDAAGPLWQRKMAAAVAAQGYDSVVKYVWASQSRAPGHAQEQGAKLDRILNRIAAKFPSGDPVNIHFIGHSEGAIVNSRAAQLLQYKEAPGIAAGFMKMTMLDPHAANNHAPGYQYSIKGGMVGSIARDTIRLFQWQAEDPIARVPNNVDSAEVFYQHTRVSVANTNHGIYNLWGQVPVIGKADYFDVTGPGISHGGDFGVPMWYTFNVVPTLGAGGHFIDPSHPTGSRVLNAGDVSTKWYSTATTSQPEFAGTSSPGASITLLAARNDSFGWKRVAQAKADSTGHWDITSKPLHNGRYRFAVRVGTAAFPNFPAVQVTPRVRLGSVTIRSPRTRHATGALTRI